MKREKRFEYESYDASNPLPEPDRRLVEAAECATRGAHAPIRTSVWEPRRALPAAAS